MVAADLRPPSLGAPGEGSGRGVTALKAAPLDPWAGNCEGGVHMGDKSDRASGTVKEAAGKATRNPDLAAKGRREQIKGDVKKSGKKLKDAAKKM